MYYKNTHSETNYKECDITQYESIANMPTTKTKPIGINTAKMSKIKKELLPQMPFAKRLYWENLPKSDESNDLCFNHQ